LIGYYYIVAIIVGSTNVNKKSGTLFLPITLANVNRFSKFFYRETQQ